jgi:hypothetical protein
MMTDTQELKYVSREDLLKSENVHLRAIVASQKVDMCRKELMEAQRLFDESQQAVLAFRNDLEARYEISLSTHEIEQNTGLIKPRGRSMQDMLAEMVKGAGVYPMGPPAPFQIPTPQEEPPPQG